MIVECSVNGEWTEIGGAEARHLVGDQNAVSLPRRSSMPAAARAYNGIRIRVANTHESAQVVCTSVHRDRVHLKVLT